MFNHLCKNPFKIFFPAALLCLLYASLLWTFYGLFHFGVFPVQQHANLLIGGFLYYSIFGFLLTVIPHFLQTEKLSRVELCFSLLILFSTLISNLVSSSLFFWLFIFTGFFFLSGFLYNNFSKRNKNPPVTFSFLVGGLFFGVIGSASMLVFHFDTNLFVDFEQWGKIFFYDAMIISFIIGVGGNSISSNLENENKYATNLKTRSFFSTVPLEITLGTVILSFTYFLEVYGINFISYGLRAILISFFSIKYWRIHKGGKGGSFFGRMIRVACWLLLISSWLLCFTEVYQIHVKHLAYIGSYCLLSLMVSSRVILVYAENSLDFENRKMPYLIVGGFVVLAAFTRSSAIFIPDSYVRHLGYAGLVLFCSGFFYGIFFGKKLFSTQLGVGSLSNKLIKQE
jgi:hypothetical protein